MADQVTDKRTSIFNGDDSPAITVDLAGTGSGTLDTVIFYEGTGSVGGYCTNVRDGLLFDAGVVQAAWANSHFYLLVNCGIVGLLGIKSNGGLAVRFCGNVVGEWFEVYVGGNDDWPTSFGGGWAQFVVDIEDAYANASAIGAAKPATNACRYVGISFITASAMPRMVDNTWLDEIAYLPDGTSGILVEGRNGGATDWAWNDIVSAADTGKWGTCRRGPGGSVILNTSVEFGANDATTHQFTDTNQTILFEDQQYVAADLYGFTVVGGAGTQSFTAGNKQGAGDAATGNQGWVIAAASTGQPWSFDADDANVDAANLYGCTFIHADDFQIDDAQVEVRSCLFNDVTSATISAGIIARNTIVNANTDDAIALFTTSSLTDIKNNAFTFSDGHAIELTSNAGSPFAFVGNTFTGYGGTPGNNLLESTGSTDACIFNDSNGEVTINVTSGDTPSIRNGAGATTYVNNNKSVDVHVQDVATDDIVSAVVAIYDSSDDSELSNSLTDANGDISTASIANATNIYIRVRKSTSDTRYFPIETVAYIDNDVTITITMTEDTTA